MEIVMTGEYSGFMRTMIDKLNKEGNHVFVLSGAQYDRDKFPKVYEQYDFAYDSPSMRQVFESMSPDAVIFTGAYDTSFNWALGQPESVRFSTGLSNVLIALSGMRKHPRVIYLSCEDIYTMNHNEDIQETDETTAEGYRAMAVRQGELTCKNYRSTMNMDIVILRLDHLYGTPLSRIDLDPLVGRMAREGLETGRISANPNHTFSMLHVQDAVDYIYQVITADKPEYDTYNLSTGEAMTESDLAAAVAKGFGSGVEVVETAAGRPFRRVLSNTRFAGEFRSKVFHHAGDEVSKLVPLLRRNADKFFYEDDGSGGFLKRFGTKFGQIVKALLPFFENMLLFIPFFMLNNRATGSEYFANLDFFLLYVLLFALLYGQGQATFSAILATGGYLFRQQYTRSGFDVMLDYNTYVWIAQLFILGLVVGHMKDRIAQLSAEKQEEINYLNGQVSDITEINTTNVQMKGILEEQVINQNDSFGKVYNITSTLDAYEPEEVLFYAAEVLEKLIRSEDVAIYTVANRSYARLFAATSRKARSLGNSIEYPKMLELYEEISNDRVFINRNMDGDYPHMADAIYSEDEMQLIIMVWGIPWDRMNLGQANMLRIAGFLIQNAVLRANRYMDALEKERYVSGTQMLDEEAFSTLLKAFVSAEQRDLTECCVLKITGIPESGEEDCARAIVAILRNSDYFGKLPDGHLYALLSNTSRENAAFVIGRIEKAGYGADIMEDIAV